jgi:hypothetical protein
MIEYLKLGAEALILTMAVEVIVAWCFGLRNKAGLAAILLINLITNPAMNFLILLNDYLGVINSTTIFTVCLEVFVVLIEWKLLTYALRMKNKKALGLSLGMNAASYLAGLLIFSF